MKEIYSIKFVQLIKWNLLHSYLLCITHQNVQFFKCKQYNNFCNIFIPFAQFCYHFRNRNIKEKPEKNKEYEEIKEECHP